VHAETEHGLALAGPHSTGLTEHPVLPTPLLTVALDTVRDTAHIEHPLDAVGRCSFLLRESSCVDHNTMPELAAMPRG
jgi:hypothetical protein